MGRFKKWFKKLDSWGKLLTVSLAAIVVFGSAGAVSMLQQYVPPSNYRLDVIYRGHYKPSSYQADDNIEFPDKINENFMHLDTAAQNDRARIVALEAGGGGGGSVDSSWIRINTDSILELTTSAGTYIGDDDGGIWVNDGGVLTLSGESNIAAASGVMFSFGVTSIEAFRQIYPSGHKTLNFGTNARFWVEGHFDRVNVDTNLVYLDVTGSGASLDMTLTSPLAGTVNLNNLSGGGSTPDSSALTYTTDSIFALTGDTVYVEGIFEKLGNLWNDYVVWKDSVRNVFADSIELKTVAPILNDTIPWFVFGAGSGAAADSTLFENLDANFGTVHNPIDTAYIVNFVNLLMSTGDSLKFNAYIGDRMTDTRDDSMFTNPLPLGTYRDTISPTKARKVPPGKDVWIGLTGGQITNQAPNRWEIQINRRTIRD